MKLTLATPEEQLYSGEVAQVNLPSAGGEIGVRPGHAPLVVALIPGVVEVYAERGKTPEHFALTGGFAEVSAELVTVLATSAAAASNLEEEAIVEAKKRAEDARTQAATDEDFADATALLEKSVAELKTVQRRKKWR